MVEAAAGTGKTTELVKRIVAVLRAGRTTVDRLVAVTFTRKAAGELKLRLRQELDRALSEARSAASYASRTGAHRTRLQGGTVDQIRNLEEAIEHLEEAHVGTIHSFCAEILRERPVEANIDPAFEALSEIEAPRLYRQAFKHWSQEKLGAPPPGLRRSLARLACHNSEDDRSPMEQIQEAAWKLVEWRDYPAPWHSRPFPREAEIDQLVDQIVHLSELCASCPNESDKLLTDLLPLRQFTAAVQRAEAVSLRDYDALEGLLVKLIADLRRGKKRKGTGPFAQGVSREAVLKARENLMEELADFKRRADADLAALLHSEMGELVERYDRVKRSSGKLDFVDLLLDVRNLVVGNREVRNYLQRQFTHIFVDEFQDTDPLQAEVLLLLAADDPNETLWLQVKPVPGKLFLVGDPKQSVYRFRRADVVLYHKLRDALTARGVALVHLRKSYRAVPMIQQCINSAFAPEMTGNAAIGQPEYVPLEEYSKPIEAQPSIIALPAPYPRGSDGVVRKGEVEKCLPDVVAAFVEWLLRESRWRIHDGEEREREIPISPRHICILFRRFVSWRHQRGRTDMTREYLRALEARDIPHLLVGARSFHQREEVETLRSALTAIEWPDDELSVFATLKGSLFAIPDSILLRFKQQVRSLHPFHPIPGGLAPEFDPVVQALALLADLNRRRNWRPIVETANALLEAVRAHAAFALRPAGNQVLANVYRICDLARSFELGGGISFRGFVEELESQAQRNESTEAPVPEEGAEGVRIMTVHGAKGLEFPVVILADITAGLTSNQPDLYVDAEQKLCAMRLLGCAPWDLLDHEREEAQRDFAEGVRVAYVAATRARDLLVIPAVEDQISWESIFRTWGSGWLLPLHKAIYPAKECRRTPERASGCPKFGESTVISNDDQLIESAIKPGLHRPQQGSHRVVWWDPRTLRLGVEGNFGVRQAEILQEGGEAATESIRNYEEWKELRTRVLEEGRHLGFDVFAVTELTEPPANFQAEIRVELLEKPGDRPQGARFGTLVHTILRDVDLRAAQLADDNQKDIAARAEVHGRVLGSTPEEIAAAARAVSATLKHPLLLRAGVAVCCYRELPIMAKSDDGRLLEGNIDLAFLEEGAWTIVDFKSDADLPSRGMQYQCQLQWYAFALSQITGAPVRGWLLGV